MRWLHEHSAPWINAGMEQITHAGDMLTLITFSVLLSCYFFKRYRRKREPITIMVALGLGGFLTSLLKLIFHRERPSLWEFIERPESYSFPSGHTMVSMVVYGTAAYLLETAFPRARWVWRLSALALVFLIGISRLYLGVHWPSDVIAGFVAGLAIVFNIIYWYSRNRAALEALPSPGDQRSHYSDPR